MRAKVQKFWNIPTYGRAGFPCAAAQSSRSAAGFMRGGAGSVRSKAEPDFRAPRQPPCPTDRAGPAMRLRLIERPAAATHNNEHQWAASSTWPMPPSADETAAVRAGVSTTQTTSVSWHMPPSADETAAVRAGVSKTQTTSVSSPVAESMIKPRTVMSAGMS